MRRADIRAYVARDWRAVGELKERFWVEQRRRYGAAGALDVANELRQQVLALRPEWPSPEERDEDIAVHARVTAVLRRARPTRAD